jgi:1,4-dihydroxy-2-naphthoate octaprenyltransferase
MRVDRRVVLRYRAAFGIGFLALGAVMLWKIVAQPAPIASKTLGILLALVLMGLGGTRIALYLRARREGAA